MRQSPEFSKKIITDSRAQFQTFRSKFGRKQTSEVPLPAAANMNQQQRRILPLAVIITLFLGLYLIADYIIIILLAFVAAVVFFPIYEWIAFKTKRSGLAAMLTFFVTLFVIIIPLVFTVIITISETERLIHDLSVLSHDISFTDTGSSLLQRINTFLGSITDGAVQISAAKAQETVVSMASSLADFFLNLLTSSFSGIASFITQFILYIFIFTAILTNSDTLKRTFKAMNPLGDKTSEVYLHRAGKMTKGAVGGQFIIAICQGVAEAGVLYIAGIDYFFFMALLLTFLSIVPLGGGVIAIPIGIGMLLTGNIWQGLFVLAMHFLVIVNIDNVLRPRLIPKAVRMNSALMLLAVFGGIGVFGFLGIVVGPVIMIIVLTTLEIYMPVAEKEHIGS